MGFISNLFKGFVRSAVNQVGRDGGRVISNNVYKNKHSTPVDIKSTTNENTYSDKTHNERLQFGDKDGIIPVLTTTGETLTYYEYPKGTGLTCLHFILSISCPPIGTFYLWYMAYQQYKDVTYEVVVPKKETLYKRDRRYSTGKRPVGVTTTYTSYRVYGQADDLKRNKQIAINIVITSLIPLIIALIFLYLSQ